MNLEDVRWGSWVKRTRKSDSTSVSLRFGPAVDELAGVLSSVDYPSRVSIAGRLAGGSIETADYVYQLEENQ